MHELPLVIFTVLAQTSVGAFVLLLIAHKLAHITDRQLAVGLFSAMCVFGVGLLASMAHLGQPFRAFNVLNGIGRSPMSNEVVCVALFAALGGLSALGMLLNKGSKGLLQMLAMVGAVAGLALVFVIPSVYKIATVNAWANDYTMIFMVLTAFITGGALAALLGAVRLGSIVSAVAVIASLALKPGYFADIWNANGMLATAQVSWLTVQFALLATGLMLASMAGAKNCGCKTPLFACVAALLVAELCGRIAFYNLWAIPM